MKEWYIQTGYPRNGEEGSALEARAELNAIEASFNPLPVLTEAGALVQVGPGGRDLRVMPAPIGAWGTPPAITCSTPGNLTIVYSIQASHYVRVGPLVLASFKITTTSFTHTTASGSVFLTGIGSTPPNPTADNIYDLGAFHGNYTKATYTTLAFGSLSSSGWQLLALGSGVTPAAVQITDLPTGTQLDWYGTVLYRTG